MATFHASPWVATANGLRQECPVYCEGGVTQLQRLLEHCLTQRPGSTSLKAIIFVGDAVRRCQCAERPRCPMPLGKASSLHFSGGSDSAAGSTFASIATLSGGVHFALGDDARISFAGFFNRLFDWLSAVARRWKVRRMKVINYC